MFFPLWRLWFIYSYTESHEFFNCDSKLVQTSLKQKRYTFEYNYLVRLRLVTRVKAGYDGRRDSQLIIIYYGERKTVMAKVTQWMALFFSLSLVTACAKKVPLVDLSAIDQKIVQRCTEEVGVMVGLDERYHEYWNRGYDDSSYAILGGPMTPAKRRLLKVLSEKGIEKASRFSVIHYRKKPPEVEVQVWKKDGSVRPVNVVKTGTEALADWPCELGFPRRSSFRVSTLMVGDTVEIKTPLSGPDKLVWHFGSSRFCLAKSLASFGHDTDDDRPDLRAVVVDASGGVARTSEGEAYPMVFELKKVLMPISPARLPFVLTAFRCPGWENLRGQLLQTALWMARAGSVSGKGLVHPVLLKPIAADEKKRRIQTTADWLTRSLQVVPADVPMWMRWMPLEPAHKMAKRRQGSSGTWAALAFRVLEDAGLKPRFALIHTDSRNPFVEDLPSLSQFDTLAVVVDDEDGKSHWLVPGLVYHGEDQPPAKIRGRKALVLERWWIDREQGAGTCKPVATLGFSCQMTTPEPVEVKLVTVGE